MLSLIRALFSALTLLLLLGAPALYAAPTTPTSDFTDNGNGTVTHNTTGLTWKRCAEGMTWTGSTCSGTANGYTWDQASALSTSTWRLPTIDELSSIVESNATNPAINTTIFPFTPSSDFWSATNTSGSYRARSVNFENGYAGSSYTDREYKVRLMRNATLPPTLTGISLSVAALTAGASLTATIIPSPSSASLGTCTSSNTAIATVSGSTVTAGNAAGTATITCGGKSTILTVASAADTQPPSVPTALTATASSAGRINLMWGAATDNVAVTAYRLHRNGTLIGTATATSYSDTGLTAVTTYTYTVAACDAANNCSAHSTAASASAVALAPAPVINHITINNASVPVVVSGSETFTATAPAQPVVAVGNSASPTVVTSESADASVNVSVDSSSGNTVLNIALGIISLQTHAASQPQRSRLASAGNPSRRALTTTQERLVYAGESVTLDSNGQILSHRAASASGSNGAGDPLALAGQPSSLTLNTSLPNLKGSLTRLNNQTLEQAVIATLGSGFSLGNGGQNASGTLPLQFSGLTVQIIPLGTITIDSTRADGLSLTADGLYEFTRSGVLMQFATAVRDISQFATDIAASSTFSGATTELRSDGILVLNKNGTATVMQPDLIAESTTGTSAAIDSNAQGEWRYRDAQGYRHTLHPAFADLATLRAILTAAIPGIAVNRGNGVTTATLGGTTYTLVPDYTLTTPPAEQAGRSWWSGTDGKLTIRNADGTAQGFAVR